MSSSSRTRTRTRSRSRSRSRNGCESFSLTLLSATKWAVAPLVFAVPLFLAVWLLDGSPAHRVGAYRWWTELLPLGPGGSSVNGNIFYDNVFTWATVTLPPMLLYTPPIHKALVKYKFDPEVPELWFMMKEAFLSIAGLGVLSIIQMALLRDRSMDNLAMDTSTALTLPGALFWTLVLAVSGDAWFYAHHRLLHWGPLYRAVHKEHHKSFNTCPLSGISMHPVEHFFYFFPLLLCRYFPIPEWAVRVHGIALLIFPLPGHCGFGFGLFSKFHWIHHTKFNYNFGSNETWDRLLGTMYTNP